MSEMILGNDDLIRRKDAIKALEKWKEAEARPIKDYGKLLVLGRTSAFADAVAAMVFVPSAEPEVIRCKDCKYYEIVQLTKSGEDDKRCKPSVCVKGKYAVGRNENWFCADAERRTDG